eukprot:5586226-Amphidinium_carterae.3
MVDAFLAEVEVVNASLPFCWGLSGFVVCAEGAGDCEPGVPGNRLPLCGGVYCGQRCVFLHGSKVKTSRVPPKVPADEAFCCRNREARRHVQHQTVVELARVLHDGGLSGESEDVNLQLLVWRVAIQLLVGDRTTECALCPLQVGWDVTALQMATSVKGGPAGALPGGERGLLLAGGVDGCVMPTVSGSGGRGKWASGCMVVLGCCARSLMSLMKSYTDFVWGWYET